MASNFYSGARKTGKRAQAKARRLTILMRAYLSDPENRFGFHSEAVNLAKRIGFHVRVAELLAVPKSGINAGR